MKAPDFTDAPCRESPALFFPTGGYRQVAAMTAAAKAVCARCPQLLQDRCLQVAMTETDGHGRPLQGIWSGLTMAERERLRRKRGAA